MQTATLNLPVETIKRALASTCAFLLLMTGLAAAPAAAEGAERLVSVIVQSVGISEAKAAVESVGGTVTSKLKIVNGVAAMVPADSLGLLRTSPILRVSNNDKVEFNGVWNDNSLNTRVAKTTGSHTLWGKGVTGRGVSVAVLDTGIYAAHPDLAGRVVACKDFSHEAGTEAECQDTFGHGTFMAGLIAGNGASSGGKVMGAAPEANLVAVKVAGFDGSTDVAQILAGIQWTVAHKDAYNIRVLNLSLGTDSTQDYRISPLNYAVERAWDAGIAVVVSAGNSGPDGGTMMKPGDDPFVITVGASDEQGSVPTKDDRVGVFSSRGPTASNGLAKPDLVAPGVHTISLRSPGSNIDQQFGSTATVEGSYFKGTGTSMSTAVVSGIAAQVLQANPGLSPDQVKYRLMQTARPIADTDPMQVGKGLVDAAAATTGTLINGSANAGVTPSLGVGLIDADRGSVRVDVDGAAGMVTLAGEFIGQLDDPENLDPTNLDGFVPWLGSAWRTDGWDVSSWPGSAWRGSAWRGSAWRGSAWRQTEWDGSAWRGSAWRNEDWEGSAWRGSAWRGMDWSGSAWRASSWQTAWYAAAWD